MGRPDKMFRWCFNIFIFLMCFQLGMLLFLKSLYYKAEQRLEENKAQVSFQCGDFDKDTTYWNIDKSLTLNQVCQDKHCPDSYWYNRNEQNQELHVLSVVRPQPTQKKDGEIQYGHYVDVKIAPTEKPVTLALVSQNMMQWNLKPEEGAKIKEVLVLGSELVWVEGLPKEAKLTYFSKDEICAYPSAWEELANSENQFRRLFMALKDYTHQEITSFQGKEVGREMRVPFKSPLLARGERLPSSEKTKAHKLSLGVHWKRSGKQLVAESFHFIKSGERKKIEVPVKTTKGLYEQESDQVFLINNFQFGKWDWKQKKFQALHVDLKKPALYWPMAMAFNKAEGEIYIYNDDRGGEVFSYEVKTQKWKLLASDVGYTFAALTYDEDKKALFGTRLQGSKIVELVQINSKGPHKTIALDKPFDYSKNLWRLQLVSDPKSLWLKVVHPAHPGGDVYPIAHSKM
jgi:hypothetical protein